MHFYAVFVLVRTDIHIAKFTGGAQLSDGCGDE